MRRAFVNLMVAVERLSNKLLWRKECFAYAIQERYSVTPQMGSAHKLHRMVPDHPEPRKAAAIGGGTAGMKAALQAAQAGHDVTLCERTGKLGGQLLHAEHFTFKWFIDRFARWPASDALHKYKSGSLGSRIYIWSMVL